MATVIPIAEPAIMPTPTPFENILEFIKIPPPRFCANSQTFFILRTDNIFSADVFFSMRRSPIYMNIFALAY
jgi:hypothetical protein